jgi:hypothetical protein
MVRGRHPTDRRATLAEVTPHSLERGKLLVGLDALGDGLQMEGLAEPDNRVGQWRGSSAAPSPTAASILAVLANRTR